MDEFEQLEQVYYSSLSQLLFRRRFTQQILA